MQNLKDQYTDQQINERFVERVGIKMHEGNIKELDAILQAFSECKQHLGRATSKMISDWKQAQSASMQQGEFDFSSP